jgi:hypothetical protein
MATTKKSVISNSPKKSTKKAGSKAFETAVSSAEPLKTAKRW